MIRFSRIAIAAAIACTGLSGVPVWAQSTPPALISAKPLDLKIHLHYDDKYLWNDASPVAKELTRQTNIRLVNTASKVATNSGEQFNLLIATGQLPDIVGGSGVTDGIIKYGMEGAFLPLNKLIDQHAPNIKAFFKENPEVAKAITAPDGNIYYMPYVPDGSVSRGWWVRQDWLDKLKLKHPQNVNELYEVLKAFRDRDPNGNGKKDEIPYFNSNEHEVFRLALLWGARSSGSNTAMDFMVKDGKVVHPFAQEEFKVAIKNIAKWYAEGLIDKEIFTRKSRARQQLYSADQGGITHDWFASTSSYNVSMADKVPGFKVVAMAPPADVNGKRFEEDSRKLSMPHGWAISYSTKHPVEAIKLFDYYFSPAGRRLNNFGVEGVSYTVKNGEAVFTDAVLKSTTPVNTQLKEQIGAQLPIGYHQDYRYEAQWTMEEGVKGRDMYVKGKYVIPQFPGVNMSKEERALYDKYWANLKTYMNEMAQNWILGTKDVDQTWGDYQAYLKKNGYPQVIVSMQKAYDRQYSKK